MIILLYGQPAAGKTTIANALKKRVYDTKAVIIDGDEWRDITQNKDYSREGRMRNLKGAFDMAIYLERQDFLPILSFVTPYKELRDYLEQNSHLMEIYLHYHEDRGRNERFVDDFELPNNSTHLSLNTSNLSVEECVDKILNYIY